MPRIAYIDRNFHGKTAEVIEQANAICRDYASQGYSLTLRQLYYQFVSQGLIPNKDTEYKRLGSIINDARLAGQLDWNYIVDRGRNLAANGHWSSPTEIIESAAGGYMIDRWEGQTYRPEVWVEKEALVGVIGRAVQDLDTPYFACKGYTSQSEIWSAGQRMRRYVREGMIPVIVHLGDHDPSGIDMTRDITDRLALFAGEDIEVRRIALNMDQVRAYNPPPNPAKFTDSRATGYVAEYGSQSWELDALEPRVLVRLIEDEINSLIDREVWDEQERVEQRDKDLLAQVRDRWDEVTEFLEAS